MASRALACRLASLEAGAQATAVRIDLGDRTITLPLDALAALLDSIDGADCGFSKGTSDSRDQN